MPPPDMTATTIAPKPASVPSQPRDEKPGAALPSIVKVDVPGRDGGAGEETPSARGPAPSLSAVSGARGDVSRRRIRRIGGLRRHRSGSGPPRSRDAAGDRPGTAPTSSPLGIAAGPVAGVRCDRSARSPTEGADHASRDDITTLEVLAAPRTQRPVEADQPRTIRADAVEPRATGRADDPFRRRPVARRSGSAGPPRPR